jgi:hypothetical protein
MKRCPFCTSAFVKGKFYHDFNSHSDFWWFFIDLIKRFRLSILTFQMTDIIKLNKLNYQL